MTNKAHVNTFFFGLFILLASISEQVAAERSGCQPSSRAFIVGEVSNIASGELMYCEYHIAKENIKADELTFIKDYMNATSVMNADNVTLVEYKQGENIIAKKVLVYRSKLYQPEVFQKDLRFGEWRLAYKDGNNWKIGFQKDEQSELKFETLSDSDFIVDAGFDEYLQRNWNNVSKGERSVFSFVSIPHLKKVDLRAKPTACSDKDNTSLKCFEVKINNFVFRLFSGALNLAYSSDTKQLQTFEGVVNILNDDKKTEKARITYKHL